MVESSSAVRRNHLLAAAERMAFSASNYWIALVTDIIVASGFLLVGLRRLGGSPILAGACLVAGFLAWGFLEYALHRWVLHGRFTAVRRGHARHHADVTALISTPAPIVPLTACAIWTLLSLVLPPDVVCLWIAGVYVGYNYYALLHHVQHRREGMPGWPADLARTHRLHHLRHTVNYGVTTMFWDQVFGTFQPVADVEEERPRTSRKARSR